MLPGDALKLALAELHIHPTSDCPCDAHIAVMNAWGLARCHEERATIAAWLRDGYNHWGWAGRLAYAARAVTTGAAFALPLGDPFGYLVDLALARCAEPYTG
jgi:hypothetical protein